jgi:hypothetical protein
LHSSTFAVSDFPEIGEAIGAYLAQRGNLAMPRRGRAVDRRADNRRPDQDDQSSMEMPAARRRSRDMIRTASGSRPLR